MRRLKKTYTDRSGSELARRCARIALEKKAEDIVILDVRGLTYFTDYFVIMSAMSTRHAQGLAEAVQKELGAKRISSKNTEGLKEGQWILLDYGDVIVHIFYREQRTFYDLDGLWHDAPKVAIDQPGTVG